MSQYECPYNNNGNKDCSIVRRFAHLCESKFIRSFDDICQVTGQYSLDISEADKIIDEAQEAKEHILELRTELEQLHAQSRITEMIYKGDAEAVVKDTDAKIQSANDRAANAKKEAKAAKERADNGWERVRYLERKLKDTESLNDQLLRELARRESKEYDYDRLDFLLSFNADGTKRECNTRMAAFDFEPANDSDAYQEEILKYSPEFETAAEATTYAAIGLCGEAGEAAEIVKKHLYHGYPSDDEHLMRELGDVLWYVAYMAHLLNCPLSLIMALNRDKLAKRYPDGKFDPEQSRNRKAGDI